jgi:hypothetical protein
VVLQEMLHCCTGGVLLHVQQLCLRVLLADGGGDGGSLLLASLYGTSLQGVSTRELSMLAQHLQVRDHERSHTTTQLRTLHHATLGAVILLNIFLLSTEHKHGSV